MTRQTKTIARGGHRLAWMLPWIAASKSAAGSLFVHWRQNGDPHSRCSLWQGNLDGGGVLDAAALPPN